MRRMMAQRMLEDAPSLESRGFGAQITEYKQTVFSLPKNWYNNIIIESLCNSHTYFKTSAIGLAQHWVYTQLFSLQDKGRRHESQLQDGFKITFRLTY